MANTKHLIGQGIGFSPGSVKYIVWDGLAAGEAVAAEQVELTLNSRSTALTLEARSGALTLNDRSTSLTLEDRE